MSSKNNVALDTANNPVHQETIAEEYSKLKDKCDRVINKIKVRKTKAAVNIVKK